MPPQYDSTSTTSNVAILINKSFLFNYVCLEVFQNDLSASLHDLWEWDVRSLKRCRLSMRYFVQLLQCQYNQHHSKCVGYSKYIKSVSAVYLNNFLKVTILRKRLFTNKGYLSSLKPLVSPQFNSLKPEGSAYRTS